MRGGPGIKDSDRLIMTIYFDTTYDYAQDNGWEDLFDTPIAAGGSGVLYTR